MPDALWSATLRTKKDAIAWVKRATAEIGLGFHPDTPAAEYVNLGTNLPLFAPEHAVAFDAVLDKAFDLLGDSIYEYGLTVQKRFLTGGSAMDETTAEQLAAIVGGEAWQSGGGIWLVTVNRDDGKLVVFSGDSICEYDSDEAFDTGKASTTVLLSIPDPDELYVLVDRKGNVFYQNDQLERGWVHETEAEHEARGLESRGEGKYSVERKGDLP